MQQNVGGIDKTARILIGLVLLSLVFIGPQTPWGWIGIVPLATALIGWCPLYKIVGVSTCKKPANG
ncbi:DUF2892 domain-containing protein [Motiliproteus sp. SC1-56]|uniref:YgaP family membrane protein n=1 Tax=Motiliproteus sp. SC1-56 TaxID=2799565 RepID=UPI001A901D61|nr:DUF2892 domain-containing protein [Motiliproteus sp. SC1-56]